MIDLTDEEKARYYHRSFTAVDGLWCMKAEEKYGFDAALEIDREVWKVLPKIQARMLKSMASSGNGLAALREAIETKLTLEHYSFSVAEDGEGEGFTVSVHECPWYTLMVKSGREHLAEKVGRAICAVEYSAWASEFGDTISAEFPELLCGGKECCSIKFSLDKKRDT